MSETPQHEREVVYAYLERERENWLPHYHMAKRADGFNADANARAAFFMNRIDKLLGELLVLDFIPEPASPFGPTLAPSGE